MGHLGCFHNLAIVNSAAINMGVQVPLDGTNHFLFWHRTSEIPDGKAEVSHDELAMEKIKLRALTFVLNHK
jgi:hypothetical protein